MAYFHMDLYNKNNVCGKYNICFKISCLIFLLLVVVVAEAIVLVVLEVYITALFLIQFASIQAWRTDNNRIDPFIQYTLLFRLAVFKC